MLRITLELVPFGDEDKKQTLDVMTITNEGSHPQRQEYGNYVAEMGDSGGRRQTEVKNHCRDDGAWELVRSALNADW